MKFLELAKSRYSVRSFEDKKVPQEIIDQIIEAGYVAPTACNNQPFRIMVIQSEEALNKFRKCTECHFNAPVAFIVCAKKDECFKRSYDGKVSDDVDASIVASHMMLEAYDLGIGSTWVMYFIPEAIKKEFALEEGLEPIVVLPMGYPSKDAKPSALHNKYRNYDEIVKKY